MRIESRKPASDAMAQVVIDAPTGGMDGRSEWFWVWVYDETTDSSDLMLACYPQGDTYFATETEHSAAENVPCDGCGGTEMPLHTDRMCPNCHELDARVDEHGPEWR